MVSLCFTKQHAVHLVAMAASFVASSAFAPGFAPLGVAGRNANLLSGRSGFSVATAGPRHAAARASVLPLRMSGEVIQKISAEQGEEGLKNCRYWSCLPSMSTMYTDLPETFHIIKGKVAIMPVTVSGVPTGDAVEFGEGDYGVVPAGAFRWDVQRPCTKMTNCREGLQMTTKGWQEESPFKALQGKGTLSTKGRTSEDDLAYLKQLVADKGIPPQASWENAIAYKLDRDPYCANLGFKVSDKGILVQDRVSGATLEVLTEAGWEPYKEDQDYVETEGSKRWTKDGNFNKSAFIQEN